MKNREPKYKVGDYIRLSEAFYIVTKVDELDYWMQILFDPHGRPNQEILGSIFFVDSCGKLCSKVEKVLYG